MSLSWIDGHLDLAYLAVSGRDITSDAPDVVDESAEGCVSLPILRDAGVELIFATIYTEPGRDPGFGGWCYRDSSDIEGAAQAGRRQLMIYERLEAAGELSIVRDRANLSAKCARPRIVLLMEGADPIRGPEELRDWFDAGLRMVGLTWAMGTRYAGGNARPGGLSDLGREMVRAIDELGIIHDVSHLADRAFDNLMDLARGPVVATHSNCRALLSASNGESERHLRDEQIRRLAERDAVIGLNLFSKFLATGRRATVHDAVAHVEHICEIMGHRLGVGLGSDMDGGFPPAELPLGLDHPSKLGTLADALCEAGWIENEIQGFVSENWRRLLERSLPRADKTAAAAPPGNRRENPPPLISD